MKDLMHLFLESSCAPIKTAVYYVFENPVILTHPDAPSNQGMMDEEGLFNIFSNLVPPKRIPGHK
jgi:hypothetical protein